MSITPHCNHDKACPNECHFCWLFEYDQRYRTLWGGWGPAKLTARKRPGVIKAKGLGDMVAAALDKIGVTKEKVEAWVGRPCGCKERQERLNKLGNWATAVVSGVTDKAHDLLNGILQVGPEHSDKVE